MFVVWLMLGWISTLQANEVAVSCENGECFFVEVDEKSTLKDLVDKVAVRNCHKSKKLIVEMDFDDQRNRSDVWDINAKKHGQFLGTPRNYYSQLTAQEAGDIRYIITTLANRSLLAIAKLRSSIENAGDRIDHVHPLRFLHAVFTDEELKVGIRNIRGRGWIWGDFINGMKSSFVTESSNNNILNEHVIHFAHEVGIDPNVLLPSVTAQNWDEFIELLIVNVPRRGDHDRYDS